MCVCVFGAVVFTDSYLPFLQRSCLKIEKKVQTLEFSKNKKVFKLLKGVRVFCVQKKHNFNRMSDR